MKTPFICLVTHNGELLTTALRRSSKGGEKTKCHYSSFPPFLFPPNFSGVFFPAIVYLLLSSSLSSSLHLTLMRRRMMVFSVFVQCVSMCVCTHAHTPSRQESVPCLYHDAVFPLGWYLYNSSNTSLGKTERG